MVKIILVLGAFAVAAFLLLRPKTTAPAYPRGYVPPGGGKGPTNAGSSSWLHDTASIVHDAPGVFDALNSIFGGGDRTTGSSGTMGGSGESTDFFGEGRDYGAGD